MDPLLTYFNELDALLLSLATDEHPIGWLWFRAVTDEKFRQECLSALGIA